MISVLAIPTEQRTRLYEGFLVLLGAATVAGIVLKPELGLVVFVASAALWIIGLVGEALSGRCEPLILLWLAAFPLGYSFLSLPREGSIITLERVVTGFAFIGLFLKSGRLIRMPKELRRAGIAWLVFAVIAAITIGKSPNLLNSARYLLDAFVLPFFLAWCIVGGFDVRRWLPTMHTAVCIASSICAAVGAAEIVTGQDLLPVQNSVMFYAGGIARPNGPFAANDEFAMVGALSLFFLLFLRSALGPALSPGRRILHFVGITAALGTALMPMFRSVAITLLLTLIIDTFWVRRRTRRAWRVALTLSAIGLIFVAPLFLPQSLVEDRSGSENVYGRVAQFKQSLRLFADHPALGVGFMNFHSSVEGDSRYLDAYAGVTSLDSPHNNLTQVLAETGLLGFVPYVLAHILLVGAMWRLCQLSGSGPLVFKCFIYLFLGYWITGLTESSGYTPVNIICLFMIAVIYKYALTASDSSEHAELQTAPGSLRVPARVF